MKTGTKPAALAPPVAYVKFRMRYDMMDVYADPKTGEARPGDSLSERERSGMQRIAPLSQARYDAWLEQFASDASKAMPSLSRVDERPVPKERIILLSRLFRISVLDENWGFAVKIATVPGCSSPGIQSALFPKFCEAVRRTLLRCDAGSAIIMKRSQTAYVPLAAVSDSEFSDMCSAARMRIAKRRKATGGYNEPPKRPRGRPRKDAAPAPGPQAAAAEAACHERTASAI